MALLPAFIYISFLLRDRTSLDPETMLRPRMLEITFSLTGCPVFDSYLLTPRAEGSLAPKFAWPFTMSL